MIKKDCFLFLFLVPSISFGSCGSCKVSAAAQSFLFFVLELLISFKNSSSAFEKMQGEKKKKLKVKECWLMGFLKCNTQNIKCYVKKQKKYLM